MGNLNIFADGVISGGTYDSIKIFGSADVTGDVTAKSMNVFGSADFKGKCAIDSLNVLGSCDFKEYVEVKDMSIKGSCDFNNDVKVDNLKIFGEVNFNKNIFRLKEVDIYGNVNVTNLEADVIYVKGYVDCKETLNGEKIEISTFEGSKIREMLGTNIIVKPQIKFFAKVCKQVEVDVIEGDDIYLENVNANVVRGNKIKIGPNCKVEAIEYQNSIEISNQSTVSNVEKF